MRAEMRAARRERRRRRRRRDLLAELWRGVAEELQKLGDEVVERRRRPGGGGELRVRVLADLGEARHRAGDLQLVGRLEELRERRQQRRPVAEVGGRDDRRDARRRRRADERQRVAHAAQQALAHVQPHLGVQGRPVLPHIVLEHQPGHLPHAALLGFELAHDVHEVRVVVRDGVEGDELLLNGAVLLIGGLNCAAKETEELL